MTSLSSWSASSLRRRSFLRVAASGAAALALASCKDTTSSDPVVVTYTLTADDNGQLNLLYLVKQVQFALYKTVVAVPPADLQTGDLELLTDLRDQEAVHMLSIGQAVATASVLPQLPINLSGLDLSSRAAIFANALALEDISVGAMNFNLPFVATTETLYFLTKIASVEARHATAVREQLAPDTLAAPDAVLSGAGPLAATVLPADVKAALAPFLAPVLLDVTKLPVA